MLHRSGILFIPTESSYGIAVDPRNPKGVDAVYRIKQRDAGEPLPVVIDTIHRLRSLGVDPSSPAVRALDRLWPAPLTVVLPTSLRLAASADTGSIAVRIPAHRRLRGLIQSLDLPLTATSANLSGASPVLEPRELDALFPEVDGLIVDDGRLPGGPPSTMIAPSEQGWRLLRVGGMSRTRLQELLGEPVMDGREGARD
ncbi:MAG: L-threonylcarbamoyladenylate synthase [Thermoanaerobaculia bacterium]|nr:L-threonylcarbamoyladenylate synthase [Thermoanaerobaculia bacterium]